EAQIKFEPSRRPGAVFTKKDTQATYGVQFGRSLYALNDNFVELPMELVSGKNSIGVDRSCQNKWMSKIYQGVATSSFGPLARVSCRGPLGTCPGGYACSKPH